MNFLLVRKSVLLDVYKRQGNDMVWSMVHYDVQLFGGVVLHKGKIAEKMCIRDRFKNIKCDFCSFSADIII